MADIPINSIVDDFQKHMELNSRIFFSGPFGIGKTYFLEKFFEDHEKYEAIHLFPVNYSVARNEDIMELIKYDIVYSLLIKYSDSDLFDSEEISKEMALTGFLLGKGNRIINSFLAGLTKISSKAEGLFEIAKGLENLGRINSSSYDQYKTQLESCSEELKDFLENAQNEIGSIYESNYYSDLIRALVCRLKKLAKTERKVVLIIDDLDRIDPEHIFRILNVFAAHLDFHSDSENKFDFDEVILVGDYSNIKSIYEHRYGIGVDSNGYMDKFYTSQPYFIDNRASIETWIESNISRHQDNQFLLTIIYGLVASGSLTIRQLLKAKPDINIEKRSSKHYMSFHLDVLKLFFADVKTVADRVRLIENSFPKTWNGERDINKVQQYMDVFILPPLMLSSKTVKKKNSEIVTLEIENINFKTNIAVSQRGYEQNYTLSDKNYVSIPFWNLVSEAFLSLD